MKNCPPPSPDLSNFWSACAGASLALLLGVGIVTGAFSYFTEDSLLRGRSRLKVTHEGLWGTAWIVIAVFVPGLVLWWSLDYLGYGSDHSVGLAITLLLFEVFLIAVAVVVQWLAGVVRIKDNVSPANAGSGSLQSSQDPSSQGSGGTSDNGTHA